MKTCKCLFHARTEFTIDMTRTGTCSPEIKATPLPKLYDHTEALIYFMPLLHVSALHTVCTLLHVEVARYHGNKILAPHAPSLQTHTPGVTPQLHLACESTNFLSRCWRILNTKSDLLIYMFSCKSVLYGRNKQLWKLLFMIWFCACGGVRIKWSPIT